MSRLFSGLTLQRPKAFNPQGVSGTAIYAGYPIQREKNPNWVGTRKYITSAELVLNTSIVAASVHYFLNLIAHPEWTVAPATGKDAKGKDVKDSKAAQEAADLIEGALHDMVTPWPRVVRRSAMYRFHGFGIQEWYARKKDDGTIVFADVEPRPQFTIERWEVDEDGEVLGCYQRSPQSGEIIGLPRKKLIYLVDDTLSDSPEGIGIFRHLAETYERLMGYQTLEVQAFERDLRGTPIGRAPITIINRAIEEGTISKEQGQAAIAHLSQFVQTEIKKSNTGVILDSQVYESQGVAGLVPTATPQWGIDLLTGTGAGLAELSSVIDRLQHEMARVIGTESLMLGDHGGNRALALDKSRNLYLVANAVLNNVATTYESDFIPPLLDLNGIPQELKPSFEVEDVAFKDVQEVTSALATMAKSGAPLAPDDPAIDDVRDLLGISRAPPPNPDLLGMVDPNALQLGPDGKPLQPQIATGKKPPPKGINGKQPAAGSDESATATLEAAKKFWQTTYDAFNKYNPYHDELGQFAEGAGGATVPAGEAGGGGYGGMIGAIPPPVGPGAVARVKGQIKQFMNHPLTKEAIDEVVKKLGSGTFHEALTGLVTTVAVNAILPGAGFTTSLLLGAAATVPLEFAMKKLNINATTAKNLLVNTAKALVDFRRSQLTQRRDDLSGGATGKAASNGAGDASESDAILLYLQNLVQSLEALDVSQYDDPAIPIGKAESAWLQTASSEQILAWNERKAAMIAERLQQVLDS
jgi:hypothetical protein